jgi:hypothetical protein
VKAKNKNTTPRKRPAPPAPINLRKEEELSPSEWLAKGLAEVRIEREVPGPCPHLDALNWRHHRAKALCDIAAEAALSASGSEMPGNALATVMGILREDIEVAGWIVQKMDEAARNGSNCPPTGAA